MLPDFVNLREVEIKNHVNEEILGKILEKCLFIRKLEAVCGDVSDVFLFSLCKHCSQRKDFILCPENGKCLKAGKCLESLQLRGFSHYRTGPGIACAFQHLPMLKELFRMSLSFYFDDPDVIKGIMILQNALNSIGAPPLKLELNVFHFLRDLTADQLNALFTSCPKMESIHIHFSVFDENIFPMLSCRNLKQLYFYHGKNEVFNSPELKQFFAERGERIKALSFFGYLEDGVDVTYVHNILDWCCNLEDLCIWNVDCNDRSYGSLRGSPAARANLRKITLFLQDNVTDRTELYRDYFCKLLCDARNVKILSITRQLVEAAFPYAVGKNEFRRLEELGILDCTVNRIPLETILTTCCNLKKIKTCLGLGRRDEELWKLYFKNYNYLIELSHFSDYDDF